MSCPELSVAIYANADKPEAVKVAKELLNGPVGKYACLNEILTDKIDLAGIKHCQYLIVIGGDGTILSTVRQLNGFKIPIIGVNVGKLGFLARFSRDDLVCDFENMVRHCHNSVSDHKLLRCDLISDGKVKESSLVVNEVAVVAGPPFRMLDITISIGNEHLSNCSGDGMIISTPTGSTAYNLSAGGPILESNLDCIAITPLAAHSLNFRPIVVGTDKKISIRCNSSAAKALIDGQINLAMTKDEHVVIQPSGESFHLLHNPRFNQWQVLNRKLHWGRLPDYNKYDSTENNDNA